MNDSKVLLLFSATGGGHRSVADALMEAFALQAPAARVILVDLLLHDCTLFPINRVGRSYQFLVQNTPVLWQAIWRFGEDKRRLAWMMRLCMPLAQPVRRCLREQAPDLVISVHPCSTTSPAGSGLFCAELSRDKL